jgi:hypothetical protein
MRMIKHSELVGTPASLVPFIMEQIQESDDGTVGFSLGSPYVAGLQIRENFKSFDDGDFEFYDFVLDESDKSIEFDLESTGVYQLDEIPQLIEYRLNKIWESIE